ncbi:MAG: metallophosphoesterase [Desulfurococcaceae archaeon]
MRLLVLSDIHERINNVKKLLSITKTLNVNLVLIAGDLTYFKDVEYAKRVLDKIKDLIRAKILFVPGNCDPEELINEYRDLNGDILNIHRSIYEYSGYVFYGIGGSGITPFNTIIEFDEEFFKNSLNAVSNIDQDKLIILTHQPIRGFFDEVKDEHTGSKAFMEFLVEKQPLLWITGHIHEYSGFTKYGKTTIVHPGPFMRGYYGIVEIHGNKVMVELSRV